MIIINIVILYILSAFNFQNQDYLNYFNTYKNPLGAKHSEVLFKYIMFFFKKIGFDYSGFLVVIFAFEFLVLYFFIKKHKINIFYLLIFTMYPFFLDVVQVRHFLAQVILLLCIFSVSTYKKNIGYIICSLIQGGFIFFVPLILWKKLKVNLRKIIIILILETIIIAFFIEKILLLLSKLVNNHFSRKILIYLEAFKTRNLMGTRHYYFIIAIMISIFVLYSISLAKNNKKNKNLKKILNLKNFYTYYILIIPFMLFDSVVADRILRILFFTSIFTIGYIENFLIRHKYFFRMSVLLFMLAILIVAVFVKNYEEIVEIILQNNYLFKRGKI